MRNIIVRSVRMFDYICNVANKETQSFETITVSVPTNLKNPEKKIQKYIPSNYVFISFVNSSPELIIIKYFMETKDFMQYAKPYIPSANDVIENDTTNNQ